MRGWEQCSGVPGPWYCLVTARQAGSKVGVGTNHLNPLAAEAPLCFGAEVAQDCPRQSVVSMGLPLAALGMLKCPSLSALASPSSS